VACPCKECSSLWEECNPWEECHIKEVNMVSHLREVSTVSHLREVSTVINERCDLEFANLLANNNERYDINILSFE
jgi:hypothetical protein